MLIDDRLKACRRCIVDGRQQGRAMPSPRRRAYRRAGEAFRKVVRRACLPDDKRQPKRKGDRVSSDLSDTSDRCAPPQIVDLLHAGGVAAADAAFAAGTESGSGDDGDFFMLEQAHGELVRALAGRSDVREKVECAARLEARKPELAQQP